MNKLIRHLMLCSPLFVVMNNTIADENNLAIEAASESETEVTSLAERIQIIGHSDTLRTEAGSATLIDELALEKFKFDDINRVLYSVPGVNIREEDGYGLRPNIGFRGATPERSKKITVMEDGVLIGPAPYSAPAAYYFPMMSKMTSLEVFKGPAAIKYGPNTVAGALNMTTRAVPEMAEGGIDLALGSDGFQKLKFHYGNTHGKFGYVVEAVKLKADGFKELDTGEDTGFDKDDVMVKLQYNLGGAGYEQVVELKYSLANELSNETYLGLTDSDFYENPNRRYAASQKDLMDWQHEQVQFTHFFATNDFDITTRLYRNDFKRSWFKLNTIEVGGEEQSLQQILENPTGTAEQGLYQLLTGQRDSGANDTIIVGNNYREFHSQGIQSELYTDYQFFGLEHKFNAGIRFHQDQIERFHTTDSFWMQNMQLVSTGLATVDTTTNLEKTDSQALFLQNTSVLDQLELTLGLRGEFWQGYYQNKAEGKADDWQKTESHIWLPSISAFYHLSEFAGLLFGIHEGFIPTSPQEDEEVDIENSINYELGARYKNNGTQLELIAFFNDMKNLKESCSHSTCGASGAEDNASQEYNGGEVDVYGLEFTGSHVVRLSNGYELPLSLVYTYTKSKFKTSFSSGFSMWGEITEGDELPYLPAHQLTAGLGLLADSWEMNLQARYIDEMKETAGETSVLSDATTKAYSVFDLSANYHLDNDLGSIYLKVDNLFDKQEIVSRRPYGARPSKPQQFKIGYQYSF